MLYLRIRLTWEFQIGGFPNRGARTLWIGLITVNRNRHRSMSVQISNTSISSASQSRILVESFHSLVTIFASVPSLIPNAPMMMQQDSCNKLITIASIVFVN